MMQLLGKRVLWVFGEVDEEVVEEVEVFYRCVFVFSTFERCRWC